MAKTIDVEGSPRGWPPEGSKGKKKIDRPPTVVLVAAGVFGVLVIAGVLMAATGKLGITNLKADEVGVKVNFITGEETVVVQPGYVIYIPFIEEFYTFDKTTQEFLMAGDTYRTDNQVPKLTVRASDGSNFGFDELRIQYEIVAGSAATILNDSGPGDGYKDEWIKAHARSILRDEFGRYTAVEVANPTVYKQAPEAARQLLNDILSDHGVNVVRVLTPNPKFDAGYEEAIETRKEADQEVEEQKARADQLIQVKGQRLAAVDKEKGVELRELEGELRKKILAAEAEAIQIERSADAFAVKRRNAGEAEKAEFLAQARGLEAKYTKEAEGIESRAKALEERGEVVVREALIQKLLNIEFTLIPYSRDSEPKRLEHSGLDAAGAAILGGDQ